MADLKKTKSHSSFDLSKSMPSINQITLGESRQVAALARKAYSFQKRQKFTNICCITLCPLLMVAIAGFLGTFITTLIQNTSVIREFIACSNVPNMNSLGIPVWEELENFPQTPSVDKTLFPAATLDVLYNTNYFRVGSSCVYWFGEQYPFSDLYERDPKVAGNLARDTTFLPQPKGGWVANLLNTTNPEFDALTYFQFSSSQRNTWYVVGYNESGVAPSDLGTKEKQSDSDPLQLAFGPSAPAFVPVTNTSKTGLLGSIPTRYYISLKSRKISPRPYYDVNRDLGENDIDDFIATSLRAVIDAVARLDKSALILGNDAEKNVVLTAAAELMADLPHGGISFQSIDFEGLKFSYNLHIGTSRQFRNIPTFPGPGNRALYQQTQFSNSILRNSNPAILGNSQITQGFRILPSVISTKFPINVAGPIGVILFPFGVSFLLPIFALVLIQEKEKRILIMMKMNGMKSWSYYLSHYVTFFILYCCSMIVFYLTGRVFQIPLFTLTQPGLLLTVFIIWGHNLISLAFFFSAFFSRSQFALVRIRFNPRL
jgi:ABC-2 family transporter protein